MLQSCDSITQNRFIKLSLCVNSFASFAAMRNATVSVVALVAFYSVSTQAAQPAKCLNLNEVMREVREALQAGQAQQVRSRDDLYDVLGADDLSPAHKKVALESARHSTNQGSSVVLLALQQQIGCEWIELDFFESFRYRITAFTPTSLDTELVNPSSPYHGRKIRYELLGPKKIRTSVESLHPFPSGDFASTTVGDTLWDQNLPFPTAPSEHLQSLRRSVGYPGVPQNEVALRDLSRVAGVPLDLDLLRTGSGSPERGEIRRGYRTVGDRVTHALISILQKDPRGDWVVIGSAASPMTYDRRTLEYSLPTDRQCPTAHFETLRSQAVEWLSHLTNVSIQPQDLPLCLETRNQAGQGLIVFRGFTRISSGSGGGQIRSELMSAIWFDPDSGHVLRRANSASGAGFRFAR
jgi:hypothetical protein